jgi:transcriptional regulatory protein RtcR
MSTLAVGGRITVDLVDEEVERLRSQWEDGPSKSDHHSTLHTIISADQIERLDLFDRVQIEAVLDICRQAKSLSDAGRKLFAASRQAKKQPNDTDRLRKYLARFGVTWEQIQEFPATT